MKTKLISSLGIPSHGILLSLVALTALTSSSLLGAAPPANTKAQAEVQQINATLDQNLNATLAANLDHSIAGAEQAAAQGKLADANPSALAQPAVAGEPPGENRVLLDLGLAQMVANAPLEARNLRHLDHLLDRNPEIQAELESDPAQIVSADFLEKNQPIAAFFDRHPDLYTVLLEHAD